MVEVDLLVGASGDAHTPTAAGILVNQNNAIFLTLVHRARGAGRHTGGVQAVVADTRQVEHEGFFDARLNQRLHLGQRRVLVHGRLRYLGVVLYDADRVTEAASVKDEQELYYAQRELILDPFDPEVIAAAQAGGVPRSFIEAAQNSPVYKLIVDYRLALPLHPEFRTLPMVWYIPPLSPVVDAVTNSGADGENHKILLTALSTMRIPLEYLAGLFTAGDTRPVELSLRRLAAMRSYMRDVNMGQPVDPSIPESVGMSEEDILAMYRLLSIAKYEDRYVIPTSHPEEMRTPTPYLCPVGEGAESGCGSHKGGKVPVSIGRRPE